MTKNKRPHGPPNLTISYKELGTISIDEMTHALVGDMQALKEIYNVRFIKGARLTILSTNEYGEAAKVRRPQGGSIHYMDAHHFRPSCLDYDL